MILLKYLFLNIFKFLILINFLNYELKKDFVEEYWHSFTKEEILKKLDTRLSGLSDIEVETRRREYNYNEIKKEKKINKLKIFLKQFKSPLVIILIVATIISLFLHSIVDSILIFAILIFNALLGYIQEFKAERDIEDLKKLVSLEAIVIRNGVKKTIPSRELVPGDIIFIEEGMKVPADARLLEEFSLECDESLLTGESVPVEKQLQPLHEEKKVSERSNMIFSGTNITKGNGIAVVTSIGMDTQIGKIAASLQEIKRELTPLQKRLNYLGKVIGSIVMIIAFGIFLIQIFQGASILETLILAVSLAVAAVPEGLPAVVTISLTIGIKRMLKRNALVRNLPSVETLGSTDVVCVDKTGTLTKNEMTVTTIYCDSALYNVSGIGYVPEGEITQNGKLADISEIEILLRVGVLCNNSSLFNEKGSWNIIGDPTEASLLVSAKKGGLDKKILNNIYKRIKEIPFDTSRKIMTTVHEYKGSYYVFSKGAPELLLKRCSSIYSERRHKILTEKERNVLLKINEGMTKKGLRVLGFAYKKINSIPKDDKEIEKDLVFIGLQGITDPPREEVRHSIQKCKEAGIKVVMITGDHKETAVSIGKIVGIEGETISGEELDKMDDDKFKKICDNIAIYARVTPSHKLRIVNALQENNHVVAMIGEGVNDSPALKKADIGVVLGSKGTDVAKDASEIVLLDDNFFTIVGAIEEGRRIYNNIKKFLDYLLSCNAAEVLIILFAVIMNMPLPLIAIHLLWLNLLTDGFPALALSVDPISKDSMKKPPRKKKEKIIDKTIFKNIVIIGILLTIASLFIFKTQLPKGIDVARTMVFTSLVIYKIIRIYVIRHNEKIGIFKNFWLIVAVIFSLVLQAIILYTPLSSFFRTVPLSPTELGIILVIGILIVVCYYIIDFIISKILNTDKRERF